MEKWIQENNNQMMITGHTHRPHFPNENKICLIKWHIITKENGTMQIKRPPLEGPESLTHYMN
ncbi:hypothetical protein [Polaribacter sp. ALD11]|uniref:hypothetical protein n=1 Tax=Polaribacter sp. ALD11 TaxID=2058137 RepID=UPI0034A1FAAE